MNSPSSPRLTLEDLLAAILDQLQQQTTLLGLVLAEQHDSGATSSVQIEDSPRPADPPRVTTKFYAGSTIDYDTPVEAHAAAKRLVQAAFDAKWRAQLEESVATVARNQTLEERFPDAVALKTSNAASREELPEFPEVGQ